MITILISYLLFVKKIGPQLMKNRPAFVLREPMLVYNLFMVVFNMYFFYEIVGRCDYGQRFLNFKFPDRNDYSDNTLNEIHVGFLCYLTRFLDLFDTIFFVLRKKYNQITFLHLYHHTLVPLIGWMCLKLAPQAPVIGLFLIFNTFIHTIMYLYYALAAFGPHVRKYLWWKRYVTQLQLVQFGTCFCYGVVMAFLQTGFPPGLFWFDLSYK
ncbi:elongation of very long chain fatty acids protein 7-like [Oppia nitens]|uniref:elongation of very long chain fatty acids protein 7-like n=1 Tax=Oppia nitens TaxID=1686743 RepID=UPI0023DCCF96|nr:elongation of very long chain fatty acids protein 7-like [Oppia nitens]